jgi:hypothetical protein
VKDIKVGDWVEVPPETGGMFGMTGPVIAIWPPYAKVRLSIGGSRREEAYKIEDLKLLNRTDTEWHVWETIK